MAFLSSKFDYCDGLNLTKFHSYIIIFTYQFELTYLDKEKETVV